MYFSFPCFSCVSQELTEDLSTQKDKLKRITDGLQSWYTEIPSDISKRLQDVELSLQRAEEEVTRKNTRSTLRGL